jgi:putative endonuclease
VSEHNEGKDISAYTFHRYPVQLLYWEQFSDFKQAIAREKQLKGWTRKKKEALMAQNYELLHELSKCRNETSHLNYGFGEGFENMF